MLTSIHLIIKAGCKREMTGLLTVGVCSGWHYSREYKCYVNGHYTDGHCTLGMSPLRSFGPGLDVDD